MTSTIVISMLVFLGVSTLIGLLAFVFRDGPPKTATRLDMLIGKRRREDDQATDILRKTAFESDKKSLLEMITPKFVSLGKIFEQAHLDLFQVVVVFVQNLAGARDIEIVLGGFRPRQFDEPIEVRLRVSRGKEFHLARANELVEREPDLRAVSVAEPADARREPLEFHALAGQGDPAP